MRSDGHRPDEDEIGPVDYLAVEFPGGAGGADLSAWAGVLAEAEFEREKARILNG